MAQSSLLNYNRLYSDIKRSFDEHPATSDLVTVLNEDAVKESIINLLFTKKGERLMKPNIGAGLTSMLFEPITSITADSIKDSIISTINNYEPRCRLINVIVNAYPDENKYECTISFTVVNLANVLTINKVLERIR